MTQLFSIVEKISNENPLHGKKLKKTLKSVDSQYFEEAEQFLNKYQILLTGINKDMDYSIDCYLKMIGDINYETVQFQTTGKYSSQSFEEVNRRVYSNPEVMEYYMHGLLLSQFLWKHHYEILVFFRNIIAQSGNKIKNYLEVGGGHGLYISEAIRLTDATAKYDILDISESSLNIARKLINSSSVNYILSDIFEFHPQHGYNFITMGEVLEHVEDPVKLLKALKGLLSKDGKVFITTPTNAPTIDHIYLFRNANEIRSVIEEAGFDIENEFSVYAEDLPSDIAEQFKISMMYAACLTIKK